MTAASAPAPSPEGHHGAAADLSAVTSPTERPAQGGFSADRAPERPESIAPGSALHTMLCDASIAVYSLPMFFSPLLHPATADATNRYDPAFQGDNNDPAKLARRLWDTMEMISGVVYAEDEADHAGFAVRELHRGIAGEFDDGAKYHAWSRDIWSWNWAAITAGIMDVYGGIRGYPDDKFRDEAYLGLVEIGRRFGVLGMPASYPEFASFWPDERDRVADPTTPAVQRLASAVKRGGLARPASMPHMPLLLWDLITLPVRHVQRIAILIATPERYHAELGLTKTARDARAIERHRRFWRLVPRRLGHAEGRRTLRRHRKYGTPAWRTRYSAKTLAAKRESIESNS